jgi:hypothetical protein
LKKAGFEVIQAGNADEAIAILEARPDIHFVFTDIQMPGSMDGSEARPFVRGRWPPIKIVATSVVWRSKTKNCRPAAFFCRNCIVARKWSRHCAIDRHGLIFCAPATARSVLKNFCVSP